MKRTLLASVFAACAAASLAPAPEPAPAFRDFGEDGKIAFLGLLASAFCFVAWNKACERLGTVRCSLGLYLVPVVAFLVTHVFLGETLPAAGVVGGLLVLAGVAAAGAARRR